MFRCAECEYEVLASREVETANLIAQEKAAQRRSAVKKTLNKIAKKAAKKKKQKKIDASNAGKRAATRAAANNSNNESSDFDSEVGEIACGTNNSENCPSEQEIKSADELSVSSTPPCTSTPPYSPVAQEMFQYSDDEQDKPCSSPYCPTQDDPVAGGSSVFCFSPPLGLDIRDLSYIESEIIRDAIIEQQVLDHRKDMKARGFWRKEYCYTESNCLYLV